MRILWFGGFLSGQERCATGTWQDNMSQALVASGAVTLGNICTYNVKKSIRQDVGPINQWLIPASTIFARDGLPSKKIIADILRAVDEFGPDLIHVWGVESFFGLLTARGYITQPAILEMQGLKGAIAKNYSGGLTAKEQRECIGIKEIIKGRSISKEALKFEKWGVFEREIISGHRFIATQTDWIDAWVKSINTTCTTFHSVRAILLGDFFYGMPRWKFKLNPTLFCSAAYSSPFKGLHVAIRAISILKDKFPDVKLRIAGAHSRNGIRKDGYVAWVERQARILGISEKITWLGPLSSNQICSELNSASAMIMPSFIENCSTSMQEAMMAGTPVVASYVGGLPSLAHDEESALFFPAGDHVMCARQIERLIIDVDLATHISHNARLVALDRNDPKKVIENQLESYKKIISKKII